MENPFLRIAVLSAASTLLLVAQGAFGAGFYLAEVGSPGSLGSGGTANATNTYGADSAWTNPAGMTGLKQASLMAGLQVVVPKMEFDPDSARDVGTGLPVSGTDGGNAGAVAPVPSFFYVRPVSERARFGFSVTAPMGGGVDYGNQFVGRYAVQEALLGALSITPSFAYQVNDRLSLGAGVSFLYTMMEQEIALNTAGPGDGKVRMEDLDDWGYQPVLGLTYQISDRALLGVVYRGEADVELEGKVKVRNLNIPVKPTGDLKIDWDNPQWLDVGLRYDLSPESKLFVNAGWQEWSAFSNNVITVGKDAAVGTLDRNWDDTWYAGAGYFRKLGGNSAYLVSVSYESSPVEDEYRTFDMPLDRMWKLSGAYSWKHRDNIDLSVGATLILAGDSAIDQTAQGVRVTGEFDTNAILLVGATFKYLF